jgi:hypothetical protein
VDTLIDNNDIAPFKNILKWYVCKRFI